MYLSKVELQLSNPGIRAALINYQKMHQLVNGLFHSSRKEAEVLYRIRATGNVIDLYMYSSTPIDQERILLGMRFLGQRDVTPWLETIKENDFYHFQVTTAPFKKVSSEGLKNSRRRNLRTIDERLSWLARKAEQGGFRIVTVEESPAESLTAIHCEEKGGKMKMSAYCYTGSLQVTNADVFRLTMRQGLGPGKAYGLGMILLRK